MYSIRKTSKAIARCRMTIKCFKTSQAMHEFLNNQTNNDWRVNNEPELTSLKSGTYAYAGGNWHNVKSLDSSVLAHI